MYCVGPGASGYIVTELNMDANNFSATVSCDTELGYEGAAQVSPCSFNPDDDNVYYNVTGCTEAAWDVNFINQVWFVDFWPLLTFPPASPPPPPPIPMG